MSSPTAATDGAAPMLRGLALRRIGRHAQTVPSAPVTAVVRTSLGELKWVATEATDYTPLEAEGRRLFLQTGCTYCHSQYARPAETDIRPWGTISTDPRRWGPMPEPGEYAFDVPPTFGNQGIAPDLGRVGLKYGDEWHLAHFWNPPMVVPGSIMGGFSGLFDAPPEPVQIVDGDGSDRTLERTATTERAVRLRQPGAGQAHAQRAGPPVRADGRSGQVPADLDPQRRVHRREREARGRDAGPSRR